MERSISKVESLTGRQAACTGHDMLFRSRKNHLEGQFGSGNILSPWPNVTALRVKRMTVLQLDEVTIVARNRNIPERAGKVNLDFVVTVPGRLIDDKWRYS